MGVRTDVLSGAIESPSDGASGRVHLRLSWLRLWALAETLHDVGRGKGKAREVQGYLETCLAGMEEHLKGLKASVK
jgi:hypothetical protein